MIELVKKLEEDRKQVEKRVKDESQKQVIIMSFVLYIRLTVSQFTNGHISCFIYNNLSYT